MASPTRAHSTPSINARGLGRATWGLLEQAWRWLSTSPRKHSPGAHAAILLVGLIPAYIILNFVAQHGVNVPLQDDWEMAPLIAEAHSGQLNLSGFWMQQEEARTVVPKLLFVASTWDGEWDVREQLLLSVILAILTALGIYLLLLRAELSWGAMALSFWAAGWLIFSSTQFELWLLPSGFPSFLPVLAIVLGLLALETGWSLAVKFGLCVFLAALSTFTLAHGLLAWGLMMGAWLVIHRPKRWGFWLGAWTLTAAACVAFYLSGYSKPAHLPAFAPPLPPLEYARFFLTFLGTGLAYGEVENTVVLAIAVGALTLFIFAAAAIYVAAQWRDRTFTSRALPWFSLGGYSLGSGALATMGRIGYGTEYALASRYITFSLYLMVADVVLLAIIAERLLRSARVCLAACRDFRERDHSGGDRRDAVPSRVRPRDEGSPRHRGAGSSRAQCRFGSAQCWTHPRLSGALSTRGRRSRSRPLIAWTS